MCSPGFGAALGCAGESAVESDRGRDLFDRPQLRVGDLDHHPVVPRLRLVEHRGWDEVLHRAHVGLHEPFDPDGAGLRREDAVDLALEHVGLFG